MYNKYNFGNCDPYTVDNEIKSKIIDYVYSNLDLYKHRFVMLNNIQRLKFLQENEHYVSPNFKGFPYLLVMITFNNYNYMIAINKKKLTYQKNQLDMKLVNIMSLKFNKKTINYDLFKGSIFDGKLIQNSNKYFFLINDCYYLYGENKIDMDMKMKMTYLDTQFANINQTDHFAMKINKLYTYAEIPSLIESTTTYEKNGLIFIPVKSGAIVIFTDKKPEEVKMTRKPEQFESKSYNIITDFMEILKNREYNYELSNKHKKLWLSRTEVMDVYNISDDKNSSKLGIALIPSLKISQLCDNLIKNKPIQFDCVLSNKFNKWIPITPLIDST